MVKRNISFYERKTKLLQKHEFCLKGKVHFMGSSCFELFGDGKYRLLLIQKVDVRSYFL